MTDPKDHPGRSAADTVLTEDEALEAAFAAARAERSATAPLPDAFAQRLLDDADALRPPLSTPQDATEAPSHPSDRSWIDWFLPRIDTWQINWQAGVGLAACAVSGLWIGYAPPAGLDGIAETVLSGVGLSTVSDPLAAESMLLAFDLGGLE